MLACTIFSVFKICLTIPNNYAAELRVLFLAIMPPSLKSLKLVRAINSDTKVINASNWCRKSIYLWCR